MTLTAVVLMQDGEPIQHNLGTGRLRVDTPLVKKMPPAPAIGITTGNSIAIKTAPDKPLSRLEKLRLKSKEKAQGIAAPR